MNFEEIEIKEKDALELTQFREMDYFAVENYGLPIELMMENAGLQLANLVASTAKNPDTIILIGAGNGNNGGGGLVAARRLAAWGYNIYLDIFTAINKELPERQLNRALKFGAKTKSISQPDIWVDSYLGFSQRLPLSQDLQNIIKTANKCDCLRISLDIPTGFLGNTASTYFHADKVLSLAAPKKILYGLPKNTEVFIADLGIPISVYRKFGVKIPPFNLNNILKVINHKE